GQHPARIPRLPPRGAAGEVPRPHQRGAAPPAAALDDDAGRDAQATGPGGVPVVLRDLPRPAADEPVRHRRLGGRLGLEQRGRRHQGGAARPVRPGDRRVRADPRGGADPARGAGRAGSPGDPARAPGQPALDPRAPGRGVRPAQRPRRPHPRVDRRSHRLLTTAPEGQDGGVSTPERRTAPAALAGVAAGAVTVGTAELLVFPLTGVVGTEGTPSPVLAVGEQFVDLTPSWLKDLAITLFGTADKVALLVGMAVVLSVGCALLGVLAARRHVLGLVLFGLVGLVGAAAVLSRPDAAPADVLPTLGGTAVGLL